MPVRLRKISGSKLDVGEMRQKRLNKNKLWGRVRRATALLILLVVALIVYLVHFAPPSGIVMLVATANNISSPVNAKIKWIIAPHEAHEVKQGEKLAILQTFSSDIIEEQQRLDKYRQQLFDLQETINSILAQQANTEKTATQQQVELALAVKLAEEALERGKNQTRKAKAIFEARSQEYANAKRLWNLDALTKGDFSATKRVFTVAEADYKNAVSFEKSLKQELASAKLALSEFERSRAAQKNVVKTQIDALNSRKKEVRSRCEDIKNLLEGKGGSEIVVVSPMTGTLVMPRILGEGDIVSQEEPLFSIYGKDSLKLTAWMPERFKPDLALGQKGIAKIGGRHLHVTVKNIRPDIILSPPPLRIRGLASKNAYFFTVLLEPEESIDSLFPGQVGKVMFK